MPIWLLYFFSGIGCFSLAMFAWYFWKEYRVDMRSASNDLAIRNLRRECVLLEQMCGMNKVTSDKQMEALVELANNMKKVNADMSRIWDTLSYIDKKASGEPVFRGGTPSEVKETGPDG